MTQNQHAPLSASGSGVWVECPGSVGHQSKHPESEPTEASMEGEAMHEIASIVIAQFLENGRHGHTFSRNHFVGKPATNGVIITEEMSKVVEVYIGYIMSLTSKYPGTAWVLLEHAVHMPSIHEHNWGRLDSAVLFFNVETLELELVDFKGGWALVEVWESWQLIDYLVGILTDLMLRGLTLPKQVTMTIVQPRPSHPDGKIRSWTVDVEDLAPYVQRLRESAHEAMGPNPRFKAGAHCMYCRGRENCVTLTSTGYKIFDVLRDSRLNIIATDALSTHMDLLEDAEKIIKALKSAIEQRAMKEIRANKRVPGWTWRTTHSRDNWTAPLEDVYAAGDLYGVNLRVTSAPTPKQAIDAGMPAEIVKSMSASHNTGFALEREKVGAYEKIFKPKKR